MAGIKANIWVCRIANLRLFNCEASGVLADNVSKFSERLSFTDLDFQMRLLKPVDRLTENKERSTLKTLSLPCGITRV